MGRFISKDDPSYHDGQDAIGSNLYAYADNNPVANDDPDGHSFYYVLQKTYINNTHGITECYAMGVLFGTLAIFGAYMSASNIISGLATFGITVAFGMIFAMEATYDSYLAEQYFSAGIAAQKLYAKYKKYKITIYMAGILITSIDVSKV